MAEAAALFDALRLLTEQVKAMAERNPGGKSWDNVDRYKNLKLFDGKQQDFEEWNVKFRSLINAGNSRVGKLMKAIESECSSSWCRSSTRGTRSSSWRRLHRCTISC